MSAIEKAQRDKAQLAAKYNVPPSSVVWAGGNRYIVVKDGAEIWVLITDCILDGMEVVASS